MTTEGGSEKKEANMGAVSLKPPIVEFQGESSRYVVLYGETGAEYSAISDLEKGLNRIPEVVGSSVKLLFAKSPIDGVRAFALGMELKDE